MNVKMFSSDYYVFLEEKINKFLSLYEEAIDVVDIKLSTHAVPEGESHEAQESLTAIVMYKEKE